MKQAHQSLFPFLSLILLVGCSIPGRYPGFPKQSYDVDKQIQQLAEVFEKPDMIKDYYAKGENESDRNKIITGRVALIDLHYNQFIGQLTLNREALDTGTDIVLTGVNLATTIVSAGTKTALGAVAAGITASKLSIDKNFFYEKTVPALITAMNAERKHSLFPILDGIKKPVAQYLLTQALSDLDAYYLAGTFVGALQGIQASAGEKETKADLDISKLRKSSFSEDQSAVRLGKWLFDADQKPREDNQKKLRVWMDNNGFKELAIQKLLDNPDLKEWREKAVKDKDLGVP